MSYILPPFLSSTLSGWMCQGGKIPLVWIFNKTPKYKWRSCPLVILSYFLHLRFLENQDTQFCERFNKNCKLFTEITLHGRYVNLLYFPIRRLFENWLYIFPFGFDCLFLFLCVFLLCSSTSFSIFKQQFSRSVFYFTRLVSQRYCSLF